MTPSQAFFTVHRDLHREGPGLADDVHWALKVAETGDDVRILDAACGPGADTLVLAEARTIARIDAIDITPHFVAEARARTASFGARVTAWEGDYTLLEHRYDLIWCAGAVYMKGMIPVLDAWRDHLTPDGAIAFSEPVFVTAPPSPAAEAFWDGEGDICDLNNLTETLARADWNILDHRLLIGDPWEAYYTPMEARLEKLQSEAPEPPLQKAIDDATREVALWKAAPDQIAYALFVVRPA